MFFGYGYYWSFLVLGLVVFSIVGWMVFRWLKKKYNLIDLDDLDE